jgi:hypothetical protein
MGWAFRKRANLGPLRLNLSKSGVGWSFGLRGFRFGKDAKGRKYSQTSIPGTGIYRRDYYQNTQNTGATPPPASKKPFSLTPAAMIGIGIAGLAAALLLHC